MTPTVRVARRLLLAILVLSMAGMLAELVLLDHTEGYWQKIPMLLLGLGLVSLLVNYSRPGVVTLRTFQGVMAAFMVAGLLGLILHYKGNTEFELEVYPEMRGFKLIWNTLTGATPALAPGAMVPVGLVGIAYSYLRPFQEPVA